jgi:flagellar M-ring protein FliF
MLAKLDPWVERVGGRRRAGILAVGVGAVLLILALSWWATAPTWVPAYSDLPLESVGEMTDQLDEAGVAYRLTRGGTELQVTSSDVARARVALARSGVLPHGGRPGLELFDQPSWGMTDFTQRINYRRALEGELERTIAKMRGIEAAQVHLGLQDASSFRRAGRPAEASVVLQARGGAELSAEVVRGIAHLVASSVDGLESTNVRVLDNSGRLLSSLNEPGSLAALTNRQLEVQREMEQYLQAKAEELVAQVVGAGNARIQVDAQINFDRVERTVEAVDPDRQVTLNEQRSEIIPGAQGGAGSVSTTAAYAASRSVESFAGSIGGVKRLTVAVLVNDRPAGSGEAAALEPRAPEELARIETLVRTAVGLDERRGDAISVVSMPFVAAVAGPGVAGPGVWEVASDFQKPLIVLVALALAFFLALRTIRTLRAPAASAQAAAALPSAEAEAEALAAEEAVPAIPPPPTTRDRVVGIVEERPDLAARLVRSWLKEA